MIKCLFKRFYFTLNDVIKFVWYYCFWKLGHRLKRITQTFYIALVFIFSSSLEFLRKKKRMLHLYSFRKDALITLVLVRLTRFSSTPIRRIKLSNFISLFFPLDISPENLIYKSWNVWLYWQIFSCCWSVYSIKAVMAQSCLYPITTF